MNHAIRDWIRANRQSWAVTQEKSNGWVNKFLMNRDTLEYFKQRGILVEGQSFEDLLEAELLDIFQTIFSWLSADDLRSVDETVAFGAIATHEPNACARPCLDGYAILFDYSFDNLMISATDLLLAVESTPQIVNCDEFILALNTTIVSDFFRIADYRSPIPGDGFVHRERTNSWMWLISVFVLAHEVGHVIRNHLDNAPTRDGMYQSHANVESAAVLQPSHRDEFEADKYAIGLMFEGEKKGGLIKHGVNRKDFWNSGYLTLGWLFSIFGAIETLARRLECPISDTHPPAAERWSKIGRLIRDRAPIDQISIKSERRMCANALRAAEIGALPKIREHRRTESEDCRVMPYSAFLDLHIQDLCSGNENSLILPSLEVFMAWINASTPMEGRDILLQHPELLHPNVDVMHYGLADRQLEESCRAHILQRCLPMAQRSREIGIDRAFEEMVTERLPMPSPPTPAFEVSWEKFRLYQTARAEGDEKRMKEMLESSPELETYLNLPETVMLLVNSSNPTDTMHILESHPELLHPATDIVLAELAENQPNEAARKKVEAFRWTVACYRRNRLRAMDD